MAREDCSLLIFLIHVVGLCIIFRPSIGLRLQSVLGPKGNREAGAPNTTEEIAVLKAQVATYATIQSEIKEKPRNGRLGLIFSRYPMNFKNELLINLGKNDGAAVGDGVVWNGILIGKVNQVYADSATVQTIFDSGFSLAVRVGNSGVDSLLQGGTRPALTLIPKTAKIATGNAVI